MPFSFSKSKSSSRVVRSNSNANVNANANSNGNGNGNEFGQELQLQRARSMAGLEEVKKAKATLQHVRSSPMIANNTQYPIVVFLARGILFNKQVLHPGQALDLSRKQTGGYSLKLPYRVHAVLGDEESLPTVADSFKNLAKVSAVPIAFVAGTLATASSAGTMTGPAMAMGRMVSGMVIKGMVIDGAAIAGGGMAANVTRKVAAKLFDENQEKFKGVTGILLPGTRYLSVTGGLLDGPVEINSVDRRQFQRLKITTTKTQVIESRRSSMSPSNANANATELLELEHAVSY